MRLSFSRSATTALLGGSLLVGGCATLPASPVPAPLSDRQAVSLAEDFFDQQGFDEPRFVNYVEPTGDGNFVSFRGGFDTGANPPMPTRLVEVKHDGAVREITFRRNRRSAIRRGTF